MVNDLLKAAELLNINRGVQFLEEAAWKRLLSRVYLYMEEKYAGAADYATKVIESGKFFSPAVMHTKRCLQTH